jgi:hypothetical protein
MAFSAPLGWRFCQCRVPDNSTFTYTELNGNGEEVSASGLSNSITTGNTREVNEAGFNDALLALGGLDDLLGESIYISFCTDTSSCTTYR